MFVLKKKSIFVPSKYLIKVLHRISFSFSPIRFSCKLFLFNWRKELNVCWSLCYCFLLLSTFCLLISCITLLFGVNPHAIPVDIVVTIKANIVKDKVKNFYVVPIKTILSNDSNILVTILYFSAFFWFMIVIFELSNHFFNVIIWDKKTTYTNHFLFYSLF